VQESFHTIREIAVIAKEIMETMKTPEWQQNMNNIRLISDNFNQVSERMDRTMKGVKETGIIDEAKELVSLAEQNAIVWRQRGTGRYKWSGPRSMMLSSRHRLKRDSFLESINRS
jgi:hypothetical protein